MAATDTPTKWKMGDYMVDLAYQDIFDQWCNIGVSAGFSSDAQIASFLIQEYEKTHCTHCKKQLARYCSQCSPLPSVPGWSQASNKPPEYADLQSIQGRQTTNDYTSNVPCFHSPVKTEPHSVQLLLCTAGKSSCGECLSVKETSSSISSLGAVFTAHGTVSTEVHLENVISTVLGSSAQMSNGLEERGQKEGSNKVASSQNSKRSSSKVKFKGQAQRSSSKPHKRKQTHRRPMTESASPAERSTSPTPAGSSENGDSIVSAQGIKEGVSGLAAKSAPQPRKRGRPRKKEKVHTDLMCMDCGTIFKVFQDFRKHMRTHGLDKPYKCKECEETFLSKGHLGKHVCIQKVQTGDPSKPFVCETCRASFARKHALRRHLQIHSGVRQRFYCEVCKSSFSEKQSLIVHMHIHSNERPFQCSDCGATFKLRSCFNKHSTKHKDGKPYVCSVCGFAFRMRDYLRQHMRTHTGEKPFVCEVCGVGFAQKGSLNSHKKIHKAEFSCS